MDIEKTLAQKMKSLTLKNYPTFLYNIWKDIIKNKAEVGDFKCEITKTDFDLIKNFLEVDGFKCNLKGYSEGTIWYTINWL